MDKTHCSTYDHSNIKVSIIVHKASTYIKLQNVIDLLLDIADQEGQCSEIEKLIGSLENLYEREPREEKAGGSANQDTQRP